MLDRRLVELTPNRSFGAVAVGIIDPERRSLYYCSCDHSPLPHLIPAVDGRPRALDIGHAMILGVVPDLEVGMEPGDVVFFAIDGITEAEALRLAEAAGP